MNKLSESPELTQKSHANLMELEKLEITEEVSKEKGWYTITANGSNCTNQKYNLTTR